MTDIHVDTEHDMAPRLDAVDATRFDIASAKRVQQIAFSRHFQSINGPSRA
jgi:hypothetical protein